MCFVENHVHQVGVELQFTMQPMTKIQNNKLAEMVTRRKSTTIVKAKFDPQIKMSTKDIGPDEGTF